MNSFTGNPSQKTSTSSTFNSYQFDFGLGSQTRNSSAPLKDQKLKPAPAPAPRPTPSSSSSSSKPSWTHQPAAPRSAHISNLSGPTSMVGDILGKNWNSTAPSTSASSSSLGIGIGIPKSNPNLFGDLVGSALNQNKTSNVPLKPTPTRNSYSMGNLSDSLPKSSSSSNVSSTSVPLKSSWGSADNLGNFGSMNPSTKPIGGGIGSKSNLNQDPFGSLMDFGVKNSAKTPISSSKNSSSSAFGAFQYAKQAVSSNSAASFGAFHDAKPAVSSNPAASFGAFPDAKPATKSASFEAGFGMPAQQPAKTEDYSFGDFKNAEAMSNVKQADPLDSLFGSSGNGSSGGQQFSSEMGSDWDVGAEFGGGDHGETTTELEGLPPPPNGVTSGMAKSKGVDNYKNGQFADAIKWLSWAVVLLEKGGDNADEVLICRASCYKEVGEYKKAVADCSKVLERDSSNVAVLVQRALLYESTEKYRLGADDLRMVLKIDPTNRLAKSTIHRLNKMAE